MSSLGIGRNAGHIIEEILARHVTDDDTNYLKFVVNEMKPNYRDQSVVLQNDHLVNTIMNQKKLSNPIADGHA